MIAKQHRFHGHRSLSFVYRHGSTIRNPHMSLKFARNPRRSTYRATVVVSRKVHKSAVSRNRVRRRLYEIIRSYEDSIVAPYDLVVHVFSDQIESLPAPKLDHLLETLLTKANVVKKADKKPISLPHDIVKTREDS